MWILNQTNENIPSYTFVQQILTDGVKDPNWTDDV